MTAIRPNVGAVHGTLSVENLHTKAFDNHSREQRPQTKKIFSHFFFLAQPHYACKVLLRTGGCVVGVGVGVGQACW